MYGVNFGLGQPMLKLIFWFGVSESERSESSLVGSGLSPVLFFFAGALGILKGDSGTDLFGASSVSVS